MRGGSTAQRIQPVVLKHLPMLADSNCASGSEDLIMCAAVEPLVCILETNIIWNTNYVSIKKLTM